MLKKETQGFSLFLRSKERLCLSYDVFQIKFLPISPSRRLKITSFAHFEGKTIQINKPNLRTHFDAQISYKIFPLRRVDRRMINTVFRRLTNDLGTTCLSKFSRQIALSDSVLAPSTPRVSQDKNKFRLSTREGCFDIA